MVVDGEAEQLVDDMNNSTKALKSLKVDEEEWKQRYMKGKKTGVPPRGYDCCVICGRDLIDLPPENVASAAKNAVAVTE